MVTVDGVLKVATKCSSLVRKRKSKTILKTEPYEIKEPYVEQTFPVSMPLFNLGFKEKADKPLNEKQLACTDILLSALASNTSILYRNLMDSNLINQAFLMNSLKVRVIAR